MFSGGASGERDSPEIVDEFMTMPINSNNATVQQRNAQALQSIAPNARPPASDPFHWPEAGEFLNDFSEHGMLAKAFPCLFPYGRNGDYTFRDRLATVSEDEAGKHYLKYCVNVKEVQQTLLTMPNLTHAKRTRANSIFTEGDCEWLFPFVQNDRFVHWMENTTRRHRAHGQRSVWLNKNSDFSTMSPSDISSVISTGGEELQKLLGSMQSFNANVNGSPQYLFKKRKLLENLIEQKGICTEWFTLSMADNHWQDLHQLILRDGKGMQTEFPTFSSFREEASWKRKLVRMNPHLVDAYFHDRVHELFNHLFPRGSGMELSWLWFRIEYQGRGAPHVHGCLRLKNDPGIADHAQIVCQGRLAALQLLATGYFINNSTEDFEEHEIELDEWNTDFLQSLPVIISGDETLKLKEKVKRAKESHAIITAFHDYFFTTVNLQPPTDSKSEHRDDATIYDPTTSTLPHPSSINPLSIIHDNEAMKGLYCRDCNVQMRHKHQAYCDRNHKKRELAKEKVKAGTLAPNAKKPEDIPIDCRFSIPLQCRKQTHIFLEQVIHENADHRHLVTRIKLASKRNDMWLNSHKRIAMEVWGANMDWRLIVDPGTYITITFFLDNTNVILIQCCARRYGY